MRRLVVTVSMTAALVLTASLTSTPASASSSSADQQAATEEDLFTVEAARGATASLTRTGPEDERFRLTLSGVAPVTVFANRPFRNAWLITPKALDANWDAWFAQDPPNAVLTYARPGAPPASMVVALTNPTWNAARRTLSFTATREARQHDPVEKGANWQRLTTPAAMSSVSLFIDLTHADEYKKEA